MGQFKGRLSWRNASTLAKCQAFPSEGTLLTSSPRGKVGDLAPLHGHYKSAKWDRPGCWSSPTSKTIAVTTGEAQHGA